MSYFSALMLAESPPPFAYYRCDDGGGLSAADSSIYGNTATLAGTITYGVSGSILGDSDTALGFDANGTLTLPASLMLQIGAWDGFTLFFNIKLTGGWQYLAVTCDSAGNLLEYLNGLKYTSGAGDVVMVSQDLSTIGSRAAGDLDEIVLFDSVFTATHIYQITQVAMAGQPQGTNSLAFYKEQVVRVYRPDGTTFIDVWRDAPLLAGFKESINSAIQPLRVTLPRAFDNFDEAGFSGNLGSIGLGNVVQYWLYGPGLPTTGLLRYQGVIDKYDPQISENGEESVIVQLTPQSAAIGDQALTGAQQFGSPNQSGTWIDPVTMFDYFFTTLDPTTPGKAYVYPLTLDPNNPTTSGVTSQYTFTQQNILSAFTTVIQLLPANWFFRTNPDLTTTLNVSPVTAQHQFVIGQHIVAPTYSKDTSQLSNFVQVLGATLNVSLTTAITNGANLTSLAVSHLPIALTAGQPIVINNTTQGTTTLLCTTSGAVSSGATSIPINAITANSNYAVGVQIGIPISATVSGSDFSNYRKRIYQYADTRVTDTATAQSLAQYFLNTMDLIQYRFKLRIIDYRGDAQTGLGYDIETIQVGDTAQIINPTGAGQASVPLWDTAVWDSDKWDGSAGEALSQVVVITGLTYGYDYVDLELSNFAPSQARALVNLANKFLLYQTAYY